MSLELDIQIPRRSFELSVSCRIDSGCTGVFGPSGSGKTTLFNLIAGLESPSWGRIVLDDRVLTDIDAGDFVHPSKRQIGVVFQNLRLFPHMTVRENLNFAADYSLPSNGGIDEIVDLLDLENLLDAKPMNISGGEAQRCALGRALASKPKLLLLDEPFSAVDPTRRREVIPYLRRLRDEKDLPILVISHDLPDLQRIADQFLLLDSGRQVGFGTLDEIQYDGHERMNVLPLRSPRRTSDGSWRYDVSGMKGVTVKSDWCTEGELRALLRPDEIILSRRPMPELAIHHQVPARVKSVRQQEGSVICEVNAGILLRTVISNGAQDYLKLQSGDEVFCLFKALSLKI
ncbi:MAG: ATP-binding cassette domain-containing protein [Spirochaetaceae bacterium]|nr:ATP-binding cassette domain-containing protein [Spirochaetaceae bacterium]